MDTLNPRHFLDNEYPLAVRSSYIPILQTGADLVNAIFQEHPEVYLPELASDIRGRLFSFAVMLQFSPEIGAFNSSHYSTNIVEVNRFKYKVPEIVSPHAILHVVKTSSPAKLPSKSKYKEYYSTRNNPFCSQMEIDLPSIGLEGKNPFIDGRKYVLLMYGSRDNRSIDFARLVIPDNRFNRIVSEGSIDLNSELHNVYSRPTVVYEEKNLIKLKEAVRKHWGDIIKDN